MTLFPHGRLLLCPPVYFDVKYEINPWMNVQIAPAPQRAADQWRVLHHTLIRLGANVCYVNPEPGNPDLVFTANAGLVKGDKVILSSFKHKERQGEEGIFQKWFEENGFNVIRLNSGSFEGEGDALYAGDKLIVGYGFRSDYAAYDQVEDILAPKQMIRCELINPKFYHLDTCFCPLNDKLALFHRAAFSPESVKKLEDNMELIEVVDQDAERFICNTVVLGTDLVMPAGCNHTYKVLEARGFKCFGVELDEFLKGGGSAKCLSLILDR